MWTNLRTFTTAHFKVTLDWEYDEDIDTSWDETGETAEKLYSGEWINCLFRVLIVDDKGCEIGCDYLGGSIYADPEDFAREHIGLAIKRRADGCNYGCHFPDMLRAAIDEARANYNTPRARLRQPA